MKINKIILPAICMMLMMASCKTAENLTYFDDIALTQSGTLQAARTGITITPEDELKITVTSAVPAATAHFNIPATDIATSKQVENSTNGRIATYVVDRSGDIDFPSLGKIHVAGMTTTQVKDYLTDRISKTVKDPLVQVSLLNFKINMLGEVRAPQVISPDTERINILEALAACGDLTEYGNRENVLVIRENPDGTLNYGRVNLKDSKLTQSPYFYLQQHDVVYVSPNAVRQENSKYNQNNGFKLSVISTVVSSVSVIASLVIALTR